MRRGLRIGGLVLIATGILGLAWALVVWRWEDPFTSLYTRWEQRQLAQDYDRQLKRWQAPTAAADTTADGGVSAGEARRAISREASAYRRAAQPGQAIGRIVVGRLGLDMVLVEGTDSSTLKKGPGRDRHTYMPGQDRLVYIAGHRTTYSAPFAHIDAIKPGDAIRLELPYATFVYRATRHVIVPATALQMLRSPPHELLRLQACHPRFFASHRYIVEGRLGRVEPTRGQPYSPPLAAAG